MERCIRSYIDGTWGDNDIYSSISLSRPYAKIQRQEKILYFAELRSQL